MKLGDDAWLETPQDDVDYLKIPIYRHLHNGSLL